MASLIPQSPRVPIATVTVNGRQMPCYVEQPWFRYLASGIESVIGNDSDLTVLTQRVTDLNQRLTLLGNTVAAISAQLVALQDSIAALELAVEAITASVEAVRVASDAQYVTARTPMQPANAALYLLAVR